MDGHFVQFYESDDFLVNAVTGFITPGLRAGHAAIVIAAQSHHRQLEYTLQGIHSGTNGNSSAFSPHPSSQCLLLDAHSTLSSFMKDGWPDEQRFMDVIGGLIQHQMGKGNGKVLAFGEMVAILWEQGQQDAALKVEELWDQLTVRFPLSLLCAYPISAFSSSSDSQYFHHVCNAHSHVHPAETCSGTAGSYQLARNIAELQHKAKALETEVGRRIQLEQELQERLNELAEQDKRKDEFLAMLGHELRNPLAPITISLKLIELKQSQGEDIAPALDVISRQTALMTRLVNDLLDVSRIRLGKMELKKQTVPLRSIIDGAIEQVKPLMEKLSHNLLIRLPEAPITVNADPERLEQVLANLLQNAAKYTDVGGNIRLEVNVVNDLLVMAVTDNGSGLTAELCDKVFDLFLQGEHSLTHARGGLGVGLALVRQIVQLHGGTARAYSDGPGCGSRFVIKLPIMQPNASHIDRHT